MLLKAGTGLLLAAVLMVRLLSETEGVKETTTKGMTTVNGNSSGNGNYSGNGGNGGNGGDGGPKQTPLPTKSTTTKSAANRCAIWPYAPLALTVSSVLLQHF